MLPPLLLSLLMHIESPNRENIVHLYVLENTKAGLVDCPINIGFLTDAKFLLTFACCIICLTVSLVLSHSNHSAGSVKLLGRLIEDCVDCIPRYESDWPPDISNDKLTAVSPPGKNKTI